MIATRRTEHGFTLFELLLVVAIAGLIIALSANFIVGRLTTTNRDGLVTQQALEYNQLVNAVGQHIKANSSTWALGSRNVVTCQNLIDAGRLPTAFGARFGSANCRTLFGNTYVMVSVVDATTRTIIRTVIADTGTMLASQGTKAGTETTVATAVQGLKEEIAQKIQTDHKRIAGFMPASSLVARGALSSFTKDLTTWLQTAQTQAETVVFMGFPELGENCAVPPCSPPTNDPSRYLNCTLAQATCISGYDPATGYCNAAYGRDATCPNGKVEIGRIAHCSQTSTGTKIGSLSSGVTPVRRIVSIEDVSPRKCDAAYAQCAGKENVYYEGVVTQNATEQGRYTCRSNGSTSVNGYYQAYDIGWSSGGFDLMCCQDTGG